MKQKAANKLIALTADLQKHKCGISRLNHSDGRSLIVEFKDGLRMDQGACMINC